MRIIIIVIRIVRFIEIQEVKAMPEVIPPNELMVGGAEEKEYPFWTWFLPNPLPPPRSRQ